MLDIVSRQHAPQVENHFILVNSTENARISDPQPVRQFVGRQVRMDELQNGSRQSGTGERTASDG